MNRFKGLLVSDSSSDSEEEHQSSQRGRVRENKRFVEVTVDNNKHDKPTQQNNKQQPIILKQHQQREKQPLLPPPNLMIQTNQYPSNTSLDMSEKFIRQQVKPVQQQMKHYLQKMKTIIQERKKFTNALKAAGRDIGKVEKRIDEIKVSKRNGQDDEERRGRGMEMKKEQQLSVLSYVNKQQLSKLQIMHKLKHKINLHISNLMTEHHKTVQLLLLSRKQIDKYFDKVKFSFLNTNTISLYQSQSQTYVEYGIPQLYFIISQADNIINEHTAFSTAK